MSNKATSHEWSQATMEDIETDPSKYGAPTFAEFCANKKKYQKNREHAFVQIEKGPGEYLKVLIDKHRYFVEVNGTSYEAASLEKAQDIARQEGLSEQTMEWKSELIPVSGFKADVHTTIRKKSGIILL